MSGGERKQMTQRTSRGRDAATKITAKVTAFSMRTKLRSHFKSMMIFLRSNKIKINNNLY